jgi:hypothetical protein
MDSTKTIQTTKNYSLFVISSHNRAVKVKCRKSLRESLKKHGFIKAYPIVCERVDGQLVIKDGQHRFTIAQELDIPVHYIVTEDKADVAEINSAQKGWSTSDFIERYARNGNADFQKLMEFAQENAITPTVAAALLSDITSGKSAGGTLIEGIKNGKFKIKSIDFATTCVRVFCAVRKVKKECANTYMIDAIACACRVPSLNVERMVDAITQWPEMLQRYSTREALLDMLEKIYNFHTQEKNRIPLRFEAEKVVKNRSGNVKKGETK